MKLLGGVVILRVLVAAAVTALLALAGCRVPSAPESVGRFVLAHADGLPLPAILDTTDAGWGTLEVQLLGSELMLHSNGEIRWTRSVRTRQLDAAQTTEWTDERRLAGWYAVDGNRIEIELLTGAFESAGTVRISGHFQPDQVGLAVPRAPRAAARLESYVRTR